MSKRTKRYDEVKNGEWMELGSKWRLACCECGLTHDLEFRVSDEPSDESKASLQVRVSRNERATSAIRRGMKKKKASN